jgi:hypothetical protein
MPTRRRRHTITETPPVEQALRRLRALVPEVAVDMKELVILGARTKADEIENAVPDAAGVRASLIERFLARREDDERLDLAAGLALHGSGWAHDE